MFKYEDHKWLEPTHFIWMKALDARQYIESPKAKEYFQVDYVTSLERDIVPTALILPNFRAVVANALIQSAPQADLALLMTPTKDNHLYQLEVGIEGIGYGYMVVEGNYLWANDQTTVNAGDPDLAFFTQERSPYVDPSPYYQFFLTRSIVPILSYFHAYVGLTATPKFRFRGRRLLINHLSRDEPMYKDIIEKLDKRIIPSRGVFCREYATF